MINYQDLLDDLFDISDRITTLVHFAAKDRSKKEDSEELERLLDEHTNIVKEAIDSLKADGF